MRNVDLTSRDLAKLSDVTELMDQEWAPCRWACPVHADVRKYLQHIAEGRYGDAIDVIRQKLAFAGVCGRVCHHPCEANCRRQDVDAPVAIRELKRYVAERQGSGGCTVAKPVRQDKAAVAIVGGGPSGMAAALELARLGYRPTVFEKYSVAGGIPRTSIPKYRLPREVIQIDVDWICAHGVELRTGVEIGKDKSIDDLRKEGFAAVLVATGLAASRLLPLGGIDHPMVYPVLDFLRELAFDRQPKIGQDVLVIGGGNVAMDAARSSVRLGATRVRAMCLENEQEMPAWEWEQREAKEEGVSFIHRRGPMEIVLRDGKIVGVKTRKVTRVFDASKRFDPQYDDGDIQVIECDTVVFAIGQMPDYGFIKGSGVQLNERGRLPFSTATHQTNRPDVFASGEIVTPPGSVVEACASGQRAAKAIDMFLSGKAIALDDTLPPKIEKLAEPTTAKVIRVERRPVAAEDGHVRKGNFAAVDHNYNESAALAESRRCMSCGSGAEVLADKCAACLTCVRVCPFDVPKVTDVARIESTLCQACGLCIAECPANAIVARGHAADDLRKRTDAALHSSSGGKKIVAYIGGYRATAEQWLGKSAAVDGVAEIYLSSTTRLSVPEILHAFEAGADGVIVVACAAGLDRYPTASGRTENRVQQARKLLKDVGLGEQKLQFLTIAADGAESVRAALRDAAAKV